MNGVTNEEARQAGLRPVQVKYPSGTNGVRGVRRFGAVAPADPNACGAVVPNPAEGPMPSRTEMVQVLQAAGLDMRGVTSGTSDEFLWNVLLWLQAHNADPRGVAAQNRPSMGEVATFFDGLARKPAQRERILQADPVGRQVLEAEKKPAATKFADKPSPRSTLSTARRAAILGACQIGKAALRGKKS